MTRSGGLLRGATALAAALGAAGVLALPAQAATSASSGGSAQLPYLPLDDAAPAAPPASSPVPASAAGVPVSPVDPSAVSLGGATGEAQTSGFDGVTDVSGDGGASAEDGAIRGKGARGGANGRKLAIKPYIEAAQIFDADLNSDGVVETYTMAAVGADMLVDGRNTKGAVSARYERRFAEKGSVDSDTVSGIARMQTALGTDALKLDYGGYADRTHIEPSGAATSAVTGTTGGQTQIWSVFGGPVLATRSGNVDMTAHYHIGYSKVGTSGFLTGPTGETVGDIFDHSTTQEAGVSLGNQPGEGLPVGLGADAGFFQEDVSNLAQRVRDVHARGQVTVPVADHLALEGGLGYEDVQVSSHDAVRDANGNAVYDAAGRLVTNYASPRYIAFDTSGLIWDAGVLWHPSRRTSLEAHVGRRYGDIGFWGTFGYRPNDRNSFSLVVYNNVTGFGGAMTTALAGTSTDFTVVRDAVTGGLTGCVSGSQSGAQSGGCLGGALGALASTVYRGRGVAANWIVNLGRIQTGIGAGYDRREYISSDQTVLAAINGKTDQYYWVSAFLMDELSRRAALKATVDLYRFESGYSSQADLSAIRLAGLYQYILSRHLTASASLAIDGISRQSLDDLWTASGALGMRYSF